jgi:hypothetical protein
MGDRLRVSLRRQAGSTIRRVQRGSTATGRELLCVDRSPSSHDTSFSAVMMSVRGNLASYYSDDARKGDAVGSLRFV